MTGGNVKRVVYVVSLQYMNRCFSPPSLVPMEAFPPNTWVQGNSQPSQGVEHPTKLKQNSRSMFVHKET